MNIFEVVFGEPKEMREYRLKSHRIAFEVREFIHTNTIYIRCSLIVLVYIIGLFHLWNIWMILTTVDTILSLYILHLDRMILYVNMKKYKKK
jgi:hypothetical protein